jgi:hypothetical protein
MLLCPLQSQTSVTIPDPDNILIPDKQRPKVLLVGSWHFNYPGLDAHVTKEDRRINIYSERRQKELSELLDYIARFKPTKIMVESGPITGYLKWHYRQYKQGLEPLRAGEIYQIGMRLVDRFELDTIYGVNAMPLLIGLDRDSVLPQIPYLDTLLQKHYFGGTDEISRRYSQWYSFQDSMELQNTLLQSFLYMNSDKVLDRNWGAYISGGHFSSGEFEGPDALSMYWFNRNLRIYRNIQMIGYSNDDRILVLFGAGHISILKWLFECSPEYELVKFEDLLRKQG